MQVDPKTRSRARQALRKAIAGHLFDPNVSMVDFGHPEHEGRIAEDELAIRIHVRKKLSEPALELAAAAGLTEPIPPTIDGFQVDVPEGRYTIRQFGWGWGNWWSNPRALRSNPMRGGISISNALDYTYATLGALVRDRETGEDMILSNWHVLVGNWGRQPGLAILQPGRMDGGSSFDTVATLTREAMDANLDAAVATLTGARPLVNDQLELGLLAGVRAAELGMPVAKSGRRTGITHGRVTAFDGVARIQYGAIERLIRHVITIEPHDPNEQTSKGGDSGSAWVTEDSHEATGLHFAGSDFPERALAIDMQTVLDTLAVDLVTTAETEAAVPQARARERVLA